jgi:hypothetical protein
MKTSLSKTEAKAIIETFFKKEFFSSSEVLKIKKLAMTHRIRLGEYRKLFCKSCLSKLKGKTLISKGYKTVECSSCNYKNKFKL